jgi:Undecaprenyl-phosphate glucose phosphotransferase
VIKSRVDASVLGSHMPRSRRRSGTNARTAIDGLVRFGDVAVVAGSGLLASRLRFADIALPDITTAALLIGVLFAGAIFPLLKLYDVERFTQLDHQLPRLLSGWAVTVGSVLGALYGIKSTEDLSRLWVGYWFLAGCGGFATWRLLVKYAIQAAQARGCLRRKLVLVGYSGLMADCLGRLGVNDRGVKVAAALVLDEKPVALPGGCLRLRGLAEVNAAIPAIDADQVILTVPLGQTGEIAALLRRLKHLPLEISIYPDIIGAGLPICGLTRLADMPLVQLVKRPLDGWSYFWKNFEDRLLAVALLLLMAPFLAAIIVAIKLTSPGPVLYRQVRYGFNREPILVFKFRTMYKDHCDAPNATEIRQATRDDSRVTPFGRFLRRNSLDELPQLLNVLCGEMSLVGPRPHAMAHDDYYSQLIDDYLARQRVKPGITGWAQVNGLRGETRNLDEMCRRIELDLEYIERWSLLLDLCILLRTVFGGFGGRNAY